jgi:hypothetical protein
MITRQQALVEPEFHTNRCARVVGPRGGVQITQQRVRRNGMTQTWKTRPDEWRIPVKYGIAARGQFSIFSRDADRWHAASECPLQTHLEEDA